MKKTLLALPVVVATVFLSGCSYGSQTQSNSTPTSTAPTTSMSQPATGSTSQTATVTNAVNIQGFAFSPATITVKKGTAVTWTNNDSAPHQIKSATFNSSTLSKGQTFSFTFNTAGTFDYSCAIHPSMLGKVIVE
jgi:plastocyanin